MSIDLMLDVTDVVGLGSKVEIAATVTLPDPDDLPDAPVVCFAKPGGGYSKGYYTEDLPGPAGGAQADWHAARGWIFVSVDHLGVGASTTGLPGQEYNYTNLAAAAQGAEQQILDRLAAGTLVDGFPAVGAPLKLGIGQSMGGCMTIIQQGRYECYDGIGVLGYGAVHTSPPVRPGSTPIVPQWIPRDVLPTDFVDPTRAESAGVVNTSAMRRAQLTTGQDESGPAMAWGFFWDDVDEQVVRNDTEGWPLRSNGLPPWASATLPTAVAIWCITPGAVAAEAAAIEVPVLVAMGERDVIADPKGEARAYQSARSIDFYQCPRMAHMHNFAGTRELFWQRIESWADWVRVEQASR